MVTYEFKKGSPSVLRSKRFGICLGGPTNTSTGRVLIPKMDSGRRGYGRVFFGTFFFKYDILFSMSYRCMQTQTGIYYIYIYILYIVLRSGF